MSESSAAGRPDDVPSALLRVDTLISSIVDTQRAMSRLLVRQLAEISEFADRTPSARGAPLEWAFELHLGRRRVEAQIAFARKLTMRLPKTFEVMRHGEPDPFRASKIVEPTAALTGDQAREVDEIMSGRSAGKDPVALRRSINAAVRKVDLDGYEQRCKARRQDRRIELSHGDEGSSRSGLIYPARSRCRSTPGSIASRGAYAVKATPVPSRKSLPMFSPICVCAECGARAPPKAEVFVYLDLFTHLGLNNHAAEMAGVGLIPGWLARKIANDKNTMLCRTATDPLAGQPIDVGRKRYRSPAARPTNSPMSEIGNVVRGVPSTCPGLRFGPRAGLGKGRFH